jgi:hypothetical protein
VSLLDIVYCYVTETVPFNGDLERLRKSFIANGFKEKQLNDSTWKYERGSSFALEFDYGAETLQMQVFLTQTQPNEVNLRVGNWGFPFEPLLMKKRFIKNLDRMATEIRTYGKLDVDEDEIQSIKLDAEIKHRAATTYIFGMIIIIITIGSIVVCGFIKSIM